MSKPAEFEFESAPELPGADRLAKYALGAIRQLTHRLWDFEIEGWEHIPRIGPGLIAPNHLSFCDSVFIPAALPRRMWAIGKGEYMDSWKTKHIFPAMGMIPVDRTGGDAAQVALDTAARVLDAGHLFMIYPEGTRSRSGNLHKGRTGVARLAAKCKVPIIPVGHSGTIEVQPPDTVVMKPFKKVTVRFGKPMWAHEHGDPSDPRTLRRFTDAVMYEIAELSGQTYVDVYAGATPTEAALSTTSEPGVTRRRLSVVGGDGEAPGSVMLPPTRSALRTNSSGPLLRANGGPPAAPISMPPGRTKTSVESAGYPY
jgi:1-acyl-sn-glycerol-3-phosphate acyltransferase|tara:strand:- start:1667 stop:2605 length:939 start_codon:yes stop_codon:yes gene_type:complete